MVGWRQDPRLRLQLGAGKGLEFNVAAEAASRAPNPRQSRPGRRRAACPGPVIYGPGAKGGPTGPEVDYTQCAKYIAHFQNLIEVGSKCDIAC